MKRPSKKEKFLAKKRLHSLERFWRRRRKIKLRQIKKNQDDEHPENHVYKSKIIEMLVKPGAITVKDKSRILDLKVPKTFSIIDEPSEAINSIKQLAAAGKSGKKRLIRIDQSNMIEVDLAAESIQGVVARELMHEARTRSRKFNIGGYLPDDPYLEKYVRAIGIIKALDVTHEFLSRDIESRLRIFQRRSKPSSERDTLRFSDFKEKVVADFVSHINVCLEDNGRKLTVVSRRMLAEYTGEILANAEDHSGMNEWTIFGYLDNESNNHICEIAIFNFGRTISETFRDLPIDSYAAKSVRPYLERHQKNGWFSPGWDEDNLLTLVALQGHISSKNRSESDTRGQGTVDMIEFFHKVHRECAGDGDKCARMAILSGSTHILFDGKYVMQPDESGRKVISFNSSNDLNERPDAKYVRNLGKQYFPGTVISIRFSLQSSQIEEVN